MTRLLSLLKEIFLLQRFQIYAFMFLLVFSLSSFSQKVYQHNTITRACSRSLPGLYADTNCIIVHRPDGLFASNHVTIEKTVISGDIETLKIDKQLYLNANPNLLNEFHTIETASLSNEVQLCKGELFDGNNKMDPEPGQIFKIDIHNPVGNIEKKSPHNGIASLKQEVGIIIGIIAAGAGSLHFRNYF